MSRDEVRKPSRLTATCQTASVEVEVLLSDLSTRECRFPSAGLGLAAGQSVLIRPAGLEGQLGTVRHLRGGCAIVEFDYPLHPAVVDHLCRGGGRSD